MRIASKQTGRELNSAALAPENKEKRVINRVSEPADLNFVSERGAETSRVALLLDLSGDEKASRRWADEHLSNSTIQSINKADLKWGSKREALRRLRAIAPRVFAVFTADLDSQSARGSIVLFGILAGARRVILADKNGRTITRTRASAIMIEAPRLALELILGYTIFVSLAWLLTIALNVALSFRKIIRASRSKNNKLSKDKKLTALYLRATIGASTIGGMASHIRGFARGAIALGHRLKFIASSNAGIDSKFEVELTRPSAAISATRSLFELWNNFVFTFAALRRITREADSSEIDFIYQRYSRFNWTGAALSVVTGLPLALEFNGSEVWVSRHWDHVGQLALLRCFERLNLRAADFIFAVSDVQRRELMAAGVDSSRIVVNPNGVDAGEFRPDCGGGDVRRALGIEDKIVVGFVGTFGPWHGATVLAEAAAQIDDARLHFLFVGDGDERSAAESIIASKANRVGSTFTGRVAHEQVAAYLDACDILASPHVHTSDGSEFFGSPTKLFEYMAMGKAVIASRLGQIADVIIDDENGMLVEPGDASALAQVIIRVANDEALRARLGAAARQTVIEKYMWQHNTARVFDAVSSFQF